MKVESARPKTTSGYKKLAPSCTGLDGAHPLLNSVTMSSCIDRLQPKSALRVYVPAVLNVNQAPQKRLLKKRVAFPNPASFSSF